MTREYRVMTALRDTDVPVPRTYALCEDEDVIGAQFYVMERVHGTPYRTAAELAALGRDRTEAISRRTVETLATLHSVDPAAVGLADFGRPEGFLERQVRRWKKQLDASHSRDLDGAEELHALLEQNLPAEQPPAIVHGDYRLDNLLIDEHDRIAAVIDWEMATLGDPLTDVALMLVYGDLARMSDSVADASSAPGYLDTEQTVALYAERSGRDLAAMGFYLGLASFKLAVILEGIHYRYTQGQTVGEGFDSVGDAVEPLIAAGITALKEK
jgi:aminoglycoside phosphotransferase (APT) family kinase protein